MNLVIETGLYPVFKYVIRTFSYGNSVINVPQRFPYRPCRGIGTKIHCAVIFNLTHYLWIREFFVNFELDAYEGLIIAEVNIKFGFELFDKIIFKNQRFFLRFGEYKVNIGNVPYQIFSVESVIGGFLKIAFYPIFQILCLTCVNYLVFSVFHKVDAG